MKKFDKKIEILKMIPSTNYRQKKNMSGFSPPR